jgi:hypothetical protein
MNSQLDNLSRHLRKPVEGAQFATSTSQTSVVDSIYPGSAAQQPSASSEMDSLRLGETHVVEQDYLSDNSSGGPEIVVWSGEPDSDEDMLSSPEALPE